jgi:acetoin utilization deacetylase AcuC-like enzyme
MSSKGYLDLNDMLLDLSREAAGSRICYELEGGYHTYALAEVFSGMMEQAYGLDRHEPRYLDSRDQAGGSERISTVRDHLSSYWDV